MTRSSPPTWSTTSSGEEVNGSGSIEDADGTVELDGAAGIADAALSVGRAEAILGTAAVPEADVPKAGTRGAAAPYSAARCSLREAIDTTTPAQCTVPDPTWTSAHLLPSRPA